MPYLIKFLHFRSPSELSIGTPSNKMLDNTPFYLSLVHILCYSSNMLVSELIFPKYSDIFTYILIKHCLGYAFTIAFPIIVIQSKTEFLHEMKRVYKETGSRRDLSQEEELQEIGKEMLNMSS